MSLRRRTALAAGLVALLTACSTAPPVPAGDLISGRLSVQVAGQPDRAVSGGFELGGNLGRGTLALSGPFGTTALRARWSPGEAVLSRGDSETRYADLDALAQAAVGEAIPMAALFDWLRGQAWAGAPTQPRSDGVAGFAQLGWQINLARWADGVVEAVRSAAPAVTVRAQVERPV